MRKQIVNKSNFKCLTPSLSASRIKNLQKILSEESLEETRFLAEILSGEIRFKILYLLAHYGSLCVGDVADILKSQDSGISHQLRILRKAGLVNTKKKEKVVFYKLSERLPKMVELAIA